MEDQRVLPTRESGHPPKVPIILILAAMFLAASSHTVRGLQSVELGWNPGLSAAITGYIVHYGNASGNYPFSTNVGLVTNAIISGLQESSTYYFAVTDYAADGRQSVPSNEVAYQIPAAHTPPVVTLTSPAPGASYSAPATVNLATSVTANGHSITSVRFLSGATLLATSSSSPYTFAWTSVQVGSYSLTASVLYDTGSSVTSPPVSVTVTNPAPPLNHPPSISTLTNITITQGTSSPAIAFTVSDLETAASSLVVTAASSNPTLIPNNNSAIVLAGSAANRTVTIVPPAGQTGTAVITLSVSDGSSSTSTSFQVTVTPSTPSATFYRGINVSGAALVIDGNQWEGQTAANYTSTGTVFTDPGVQFTPTPDPAHAAMLSCGVYGLQLKFTLSAVPSGNYQVYLWTYEDNRPLTANVTIQGVAAGSFTTGNAGQWQKVGPYAGTVSNGTLTIVCQGVNDGPNICGFEVWQVH
jgi:hypothetical protein